MAGLQNYPWCRKSNGVLHQCMRPMYRSRDAIYAKTDAETILMVPTEEGAGGKAGIFKIIVGVVLLIAAVAVFFSTLSLATPISIGLAFAGASMILGGIMEMLMPVPKATSALAEEKSKYLPASRNTVKVGTPIPLLFGRGRLYGHFLSFDI